MNWPPKRLSTNEMNTRALNWIARYQFTLPFYSYSTYISVQSKSTFNITTYWTATVYISCRFPSIYKICCANKYFSSQLLLNYEQQIYRIILVKVTGASIVQSNRSKEQNSLFSVIFCHNFDLKIIRWFYGVNYLSNFQFLKSNGQRWTA